MERQKAFNLSALLGHKDTANQESGSLVGLLKEKTFVGIDFGTSTTTVMRLSFDSQANQFVSEPILIQQETAVGSINTLHLVPTVIAWIGSRKRLIFGVGAREVKQKADSFIEGVNVWSEFKMSLGEQSCYPKTRLPEIDVHINGVSLETPKDAATRFFAFLRENIERTVRKQHLPESIEYSVTVPASFGPGQRQELCEAIRAAGIDLHDNALLDEPNSAFLGAAAWYSKQEQNTGLTRTDRPTRALVFDFGAGTCDVTLLRIYPDFRIQNEAISRFTALGGRDIDTQLVSEYLCEKVLNGVKNAAGDSPRPEVFEAICNALQPFAERLKISVCKDFDRPHIPHPTEKAKTEERQYNEGPFVFQTKEFGTIRAEKLSITSRNFAGLMDRLVANSREAFENGDVSVFDPIDDVLRKGGVQDSELDFVLLVGGSALNPFVREAIKQRFGRFVQVLSAGDIRTLVARGAAFHSFSVNGLGCSFIAPITSEDIRIETSEGPVTVFPAGTMVPTEKREVSGLYLAGEGEYGIPFFADNAARRLGVARFSSSIPLAGVKVLLVCSLTAAKSLKFSIRTPEISFGGSFDMPETVRETTEAERAKIAAENEMDRSALINHGKPTAESLLAAAEACLSAGLPLKAADHYRDLMFYYRNNHVEDKVAECYREIGNAEEEYRWQKKAYERTKSYVNTWYLIWAGQRKDGWNTDEVRTLLQEAMRKWPDDSDFLYVEGERLLGTGKKAEAIKLQKDLLHRWADKTLEELDKYTLSRYQATAEALGESELAKLIQREEKKRNQEKSGSVESVFDLVHSNGKCELTVRR